MGESDSITRLKDQIHRAAPHGGTGADLRREWNRERNWWPSSFHAYSDRAEEPFVELNCAAIPRNSSKRTLRPPKGLFHGAPLSIKGEVPQADGGTLFLDEVGT